jgi:hypothetical protein
LESKTQKLTPQNSSLPPSTGHPHADQSSDRLLFKASRAVIIASPVNVCREMAFGMDQQVWHLRQSALSAGCFLLIDDTFIF